MPFAMNPRKSNLRTYTRYNWRNAYTSRDGRSRSGDRRRSSRRVAGPSFFWTSFPGATRAQPASVTKPYMQNVRSGRAVDARMTRCRLFTAASDESCEGLLSWNRAQREARNFEARLLRERLY